MKTVGVDLLDGQIISRYYKERAIPHLIPFPSRLVEEATDPRPEALDVWDVGAPISNVDWVETIIRSPLVIPGVTTVERV